VQILLGRSEKRQLGSRKGNTFSIAHFGDGGGELEPEQEEVEVAVQDSKAFWSELLPEAAAEHAAQANRGPEVRHAHSCGHQHAPLLAVPRTQTHGTAQLNGCMSVCPVGLSARVANRLAVCRCCPVCS
jgi:hypothetical protein